MTWLVQARGTPLDTASRTVHLFTPHPRRPAALLAPPATFADRSGDVLSCDDPADAAVDALHAGLIVAIRGAGGYQLLCDGTSEDAVAVLRHRKQSDDKPFAVMVASLEDARAIAHVSPAEERLLLTPERPIVLLKRRRPSTIAADVAPSSAAIGVMLPPSSLHAAVASRAGRPLVTTSGNIAGQPIVIEAHDASSLAGLADRYLYDGAIVTAGLDDSIARVVSGAPMILRRARGFVPGAVQLARPVARPVLACGGSSSASVCLAHGDAAHLSAHLGDLDNAHTFRAYETMVRTLEQQLAFEPDILAHDLNATYPSTRYALARHGAVTVGVQHHHAHIASVMAEHGLEGRVIGIAYDGAGLGTDGHWWGGEVLIATYGGFDRLATFRPLPLAGGEEALRHPWRVALAAVDDAFGGDAPIDALTLFQPIPQAEIDAVRRTIAEGVDVTWAHGAGRYFDALGALGLGRRHAAYEGQIACDWNGTAEPLERGRYRYEILRHSFPWQLDLRSAIRDVVFEMIGGEFPSRISARIHNTLAAASADIIRGAQCLHGRLPVALSGGCFRNARLAESIVRELSPEYAVYLPSRVPPGGGGLSLGQAVIADAIARQL
jgi:hydrogenase maturation protein HypF